MHKREERTFQISPYKTIKFIYINDKFLRATLLVVSGGVTEETEFDSLSLLALESIIKEWKHL